MVEGVRKRERIKLTERQTLLPRKGSGAVQVDIEW